MKCGFFNSVNGDRKYDADDISNYFLKLISNGVFATPASSLQIQAAGGMKIKVTPGWAFVNCKWLRLDTDYYITLDKSDVQYNRLDRIVVRLDPTESVRSVTISKKCYYRSQKRNGKFTNKDSSAHKSKKRYLGAESWTSVGYGKCHRDKAVKYH